MQFVYYENPTSYITLKGELHKYLFKVRRAKKDEIINIRNLKDDYLYQYEIIEINKKEATLKLKEKILKPNKPQKFFHLGWCMIDPKNIEKTLPTLNEIGVSKISFVYCDFSQKNFKLNLERIKKILINSSQQCGRSDIIEIEILNSTDEFKKKYPNFIAVDFNGKEIECKEYKKPFLIGPEGGFSKKEREMFDQKVRLKGFILRSESAACAIASKILL